MYLISSLFLTFSLFSSTPHLSRDLSRHDFHFVESQSKTVFDTTELPSPISGRVILEDSLLELYNVIGLSGYDLSFDVFRYGMIGYCNLKEDGRLNDRELLSIIDFTKPSTQKRFYTIDLTNHSVKFYTYVSHGKNTGENKAERFSNVVHSNQSSLGFYITAETYVGGKGFSLKLDGIEKGYNSLMRERAVVMHEADYVSEQWIKNYGRLGRSQGCPALPKGISREVINNIKDHTLIFAYYNDEKYLNESMYLDMDTLVQKLTDKGQIFRPSIGVSSFGGITSQP